MSRNTLPLVAFVSHSQLLSGAARSFVKLLEHFPERKIRPVVIFPNNEGPLKEIAKEKLGLPVFELDYGFCLPTEGNCDLGIRMEKETVAFENLFRELEPDTVVVNTTVVCSAVVAAIRMGIPLLVHSRGVLSKHLFPELNSAAWSKLEQIQLHLADKVLVPSRWVKQHYMRTYDLTASDVQILPNGTSLPKMYRDENPVLSSSAPEFIMLCTLESNKGVMTFFQAAADILSEQHKPAIFSVYGEGDLKYRDSILEFIRHHHLEDHCFIYPKQVDVDSIYRKCTAVIVASEIESFSNVVIEAMSYAKPVISTRCGGPEDIIEDKVTGYLIPIGDSQTLADCMRQLLQDKVLADRMGTAGRERMKLYFNIDKVAQNYVDHIIDLIENPKSHKVFARKRLANTIASLETETQFTNVADLKKSKVFEIDSYDSYDVKGLVSDLYSRLTILRTSKSARIFSIFFKHADLWDLVSPAFMQIKNYTKEHFCNISRDTLVLGADLSKIPYREYVIPYGLDNLRSISLAIRPLLPAKKGSVGVEVITANQQIVSHVVSPLTNIDHFIPTTFDLPLPLNGLDKGWVLRVFVKNSDVPVTVYELMHYTFFFRNIRYKPFVFLRQ